MKFHSGDYDKKGCKGVNNIALWGGLHKPIQALRQALTHCAETFTLKKASQKVGVERKMAQRPTFNLYEVDPWSGIIGISYTDHCYKNLQHVPNIHDKHVQHGLDGWQGKSFRTVKVLGLIAQSRQEKQKNISTCFGN